MFRKNQFARKPLQSVKVSKPKTSRREKIVRWGLLGTFLIISYFAWWMQTWAKQIANTVAYIAWSTIGNSVQKDESKNINVLLVGYGGGSHGGAQLADTIIVASYNTNQHSVSMISLPRDLLVLNWSGDVVKINSILSRAYNNNGWDIRSAAQTLMKSVEKITGLTIPYYAMIDFDGFIQVVDSVGGIDIYVPQHFLDREYPVDWNGTYEIFELFEWWNHLSGPNTLKYARSRHSTSDFSRSKRQQQIIEAVAKKILSRDNLSISKLGELYNYYTTIIKTNLQLDDMLWLAKNGTNIPQIFAFGYTTQCANTIWRTMVAWCILRNAQWWLLPENSSGWVIEAYRDTKTFAKIVSSNPAFLAEDAQITIYNASDKEQSKLLPFGDGIASKTAAKMRRYALDVQEVTNTDLISTWTFVEIYGTWIYDNTIELMKQFVPIQQVITYPDRINTQGVMKTWEVYLYLGEDYIQNIGQKEFDFYSII